MTLPPLPTAVPRLPLTDGERIPQVGFGLFRVPPEDTAKAVMHGLKIGYRLIDTAAVYRNEVEVRAGLERGEVDRADVFITTKVWNHGHAATLRAFDRSLKRLGSDYVDLYLIHWPFPSEHRYVETWKALTQLNADGRARSIGVSNFGLNELERIIEETGVVPAINQIELHPRFQQSELRRFHAERGIVTEAWSPLAQAKAISDPAIRELASTHNRPPAQIILRWHVQIGNVVIPKSVTPERLKENLSIFDFELTEEEMRRLADLDIGQRVGPDPATFAGPSNVRRAVTELQERYPATGRLIRSAKKALSLGRKAPTRHS
jgi:2,5-diketo-D-gluconate reductase A